MKDFIFSDPSESTVVVIFRTDLIGSSSNNFNIMKITGLEEGQVRPYQNKKRALLAQLWKRGVYSSKQDFITFATAQGLDLVMQDSNGENAVILVDYNSDFGASSW